MSFRRVEAGGVDEFLREFFLGRLSYARIAEDPEADDPGAHAAWRMVFPVAGARPFAVAYHRGLSASEHPKELARLYATRVIPHRDAPHATRPALYGFTDGARLVFFSADPARNRDDRFDLCAATWKIGGIREQLRRLRAGPWATARAGGRVRYGRLEFRNVGGELHPLTEFLFDGSLQSSPEGRFKYYARRARRELIDAVVADGQAAGALEHYLFGACRCESGSANLAGPTPADDNGRDLSAGVSPREPHAGPATRLGEAAAAVVDTLLLRCLTVRLLEARHPRGAPWAASPCGVWGTGASGFSDEEIEFAALLCTRRGPGRRGDYCPAQLGRAARAVGRALLSKRGAAGSAPSPCFLSPAGEAEDARRGFRYEDLKPRTLQDYYEDSLSAAVRPARDGPTDEPGILDGTRSRRRKELGAYYTNERLCRFMVERAVKPLFEGRLRELRRCARGGDAVAARRAFRAVVEFSVCDPTMGSAPFLRAAFDYLTESTLYERLRRHVEEAAAGLPRFGGEVARDYPFLVPRGVAAGDDGAEAWERHVLRRMLYGVDIDARAVAVACQTFALSTTSRAADGERFPSPFGINLKQGNALISPTNSSDRPRLAREHGPALAALISLRRRWHRLPDTHGAGAARLGLFREAERLGRPILDELVGRRVSPLLGDFTGELRPFCWELEFPEVFFEEDGSPRAAAGFDVVLGNPPWEVLKYNDREFARSVGAAPAGLGRLLADDARVAEAYRHYLGVFESWKGWVGSGGQFEHQQGGRDRNKWRLAVEVSWKLTSPRGAMSLVVPSGIMTNESGFALKRWLFREGVADVFVTYDEANDVFPGTQGFTVIGFRKGRATREVKHVEGLTEAAQLQAPPHDPVAVPLGLVRRMSPRALAIPCVRDALDERLLEKLHRHPLVGDDSAEWHARVVACDYHLTNDRRHFEAGGAVPLLEGKNVRPYEVAPADSIEKRVASRRQDEPAGQYRVTCADVAGTMLARRMLCTLVPHGYATGNTLNSLLLEGDDRLRLFLVSVLNSFVVEWRVRQIARSNHVNKFMLAQLPVPRPPREDVERVAALAAALMAADPRFADLRPLLRNLRPATGTAGRHALKCLIDAEVAHLFGLGGAELGRVLACFDKVPAETKTLVRENFARRSVNPGA